MGPEAKQVAGCPPQVYEACQEARQENRVVCYHGTTLYTFLLPEILDAIRGGGYGNRARGIMSFNEAVRRGIDRYIFTRPAYANNANVPKTGGALWVALQSHNSSDGEAYLAAVEKIQNKLADHGGWDPEYGRFRIRQETRELETGHTGRAAGNRAQNGLQEISYEKQRIAAWKGIEEAVGPEWADLIQAALTTPVVMEFMVADLTRDTYRTNATWPSVGARMRNEFLSFNRVQRVYTPDYTHPELVQALESALPNGEVVIANDPNQNSGAIPVGSDSVFAPNPHSQPDRISVE
ncbi:hypothetical protein A2Z33_03790 [Candidatus Gottesmanbacteria bacterium RBG_16_52_11]|uniref:Uncharacterized protein n=1 Tax=Candidatus Gottesmanbacteria bacterium RBG_16_52_11 TaxID=1798374 RepID=A0A1F5YVX4_9BACT|nr:MAG: hypothetical protein A2Z33_03790 [Candidatus Gottesmanbacteria bacterium RBG_16_52_11]